MSVDVIVIGAGGFGRETLDVMEAHNFFVQKHENHRNELRVIGIADDCPDQQDLERLDKREYQYLGTTDDILAEFSPRAFVVAIGSPKIRSEIDRKFVNSGWNAITAVHPSATLGSQCVIGEGNIICAGAQISTNTRFGRHVHINANATIGHDTVLESFVSVNPGAVISGDVTVQRDSLVGAGSVILQGIQIGQAGTIGASACVIRNVEPRTTVIGIPARPMKVTVSQGSEG